MCLVLIQELYAIVSKYNLLELIIMSDLIDQYIMSGLISIPNKQLYCPQCGEPTNELHEGFCEECYQQNQVELDLHNAEYDHWNRMSFEEREEAIKRSYK